MTACVYKITNLRNQKVYLGKTRDVRQRWREHTSKAHQDRRKGLSPLYSALRKYGIENFHIEVLSSHDTDQEAYEAEVEAIRIHKSNQRRYGYNLTSGGEGVTPTPEWKARLSEKAKARFAAGARNSFQGRTHTLESLAKMSQPRPHVQGPDHSFWGKHHTEQTKRKLRAAKQGIPLWTDAEKKEIGQRSSGEKSPTSKLTDDQALELRQAFNEGTPVKELQTIYKISKASVWRVIHCQTYKKAG